MGVFALVACGGRLAPLPDGPTPAPTSSTVTPSPDTPVPFPVDPTSPTTADAGRMDAAGEGRDASNTWPPFADAGPPRPTPDAGLACFDSNMGMTSWIWSGPAAAHQNQCTGAQIAALYAACYGPNADRNDCYYFMDQPVNLACNRCIAGGGMFDDNSDMAPLPQPVLIPSSRNANHVALNTKACAAAVLGLSSCGKAATDIVACTTQPCIFCGDTDYQSCVAKTTSDVCGRIFADNDQSCFAPIEANQASWNTACGGDEASFAQAYTVMATTMCGP